MRLQTKAPERSQYNFVLRRYDIDATSVDAQPQKYHAYAESTDSIAVEWRGKVAHTLFLRDRSAAHRATCLGWQDVTVEWIKDIPKATTDNQQKLLDAMTSEYQSKKEIIQKSGIRDTEWRQSIKTLMERGLVECNVKSRYDKKHASPRRYAYRIPQNG